MEYLQLENWSLSYDELADYGLTKGKPTEFPEDTLRREHFVVNTTAEFRNIRDEMVDSAACSKNNLMKLYSLDEMEIMGEVKEFGKLVEELEAEAAASASNPDDV